MPTAECHCDACGHRFAILTFEGDEIAPICPRCKKKDVRIKPQQKRFMAGNGLGTRLAGVPKGPS